MKKQWNHSQTDWKQEVELQEHLGLHPALCKVLVQRGISQVAQAKAFLNPFLAT